MNEDENLFLQDSLNVMQKHISELEKLACRDYFAAAALTGLCAQSDSPFHENVAKQAYALADMMLEERAK